MLKLTRRGKKGIFHIVGTIGGTRYRESTKTASEPHAQAKLARRQCEILDRITFGEKRTATFAEAVDLYLNKKGDSISTNDATFIAKLNAHFGRWRLSDIHEASISAFASETYPECSAATLNRHVYTPLIAILRVAARAHLCEMPCFERPAKAKRKVVAIPRDDVIAKLLPYCTDRLRAALLLISFTAARASECCRLEEADIDWKRHEALLRTTKNGEPRVVPLAGLVYEALAKLKGTPGPIFGFKQRFSLNQAIARACRRAGLGRLTSHKLGRHAFAARLLAQGYTLKEVQEAGGWKSYKMVADVYGHLERSSVHRAMRLSDTELAQLIGDSTNVVFIQGRRK